MTDRFKNMDSEDLSKLIDYIVKYDTGKKTVGDIREELNLTREEYNELYNLAIPAIRGYNEGRFWRTAYSQFESALSNALRGKKSLEKKLEAVGNVIKRKSLKAIKEERLKGWSAA